MAHRYDILRLDPQDGPIYLLVKSLKDDGGDAESKQGWYDSRCTHDILRWNEVVLVIGDPDPHQLFTYVRTTGEIDTDRSYDPMAVWSAAVPEAFPLNTKPSD